ncbi:MAG: biopolymer transporter ExbD [Bacteroidota bacterium]
MAKFNRKNKGGTPEISTASLPDIIFMLLFFFMVTTVMRESTLLIKKPVLPEATEIKKLEKKSLVSYVFVGVPGTKFQSMYGTEPIIQLNDAFKDINDIQDYVANEREKMDETDRNKLTVSLKVDSETKMGIITDIKQELRKAQALKINYSTKKKILKIQ